MTYEYISKQQINAIRDAVVISIDSDNSNSNSSSAREFLTQALSPHLSGGVEPELDDIMLDMCSHALRRGQARDCVHHYL